MPCLDLAKNSGVTYDFYLIPEALGIPYNWFPKLAAADQEALADWRLISGGYGIHWEQLDEDISIVGLLR